MYLEGFANGILPLHFYITCGGGHAPPAPGQSGGMGLDDERLKAWPARLDAQDIITEEVGWGR